MIADLGRLGVQALSEAEQRQLLGGGFCQGERAFETPILWG